MFTYRQSRSMSRFESTAPVYADLHTHTRCSDGQLAPEALVQLAAERGLQVLAVTDHDTVAGLSMAREAAETCEVEVVSGIELSVTLDGDELHLLAYGVDPGHDRLQAHMQDMREARRRRAFRMMERLRAHGLDIDDECLRAQVDGATALGRPHVAAALVAAGHVRTTRQAFQQYLGMDQPGYVPKPDVAAADALTLVHETGGVGVLAHPGDWVSGTQIRRLVERGLDGIEVTHPSHRSSLREYYRRVADGHDLLTTGGSDYHGHTEADDTHLGTLGMDRAEWERFRAAVT